MFFLKKTELVFIFLILQSIINNYCNGKQILHIIMIRLLFVVLTLVND